MFSPGEKQTIIIEGKSYTLGRLTLRVIRGFRDFVASQVGDPFDLVERWLGKIPQEESLRQLRRAEAIVEELKCFSLACPLAQQHLATETGSAMMFTLLLREANPKATEEDGFLVATELAQRGNLGKALDKAQGSLGGGGGSEKNAADIPRSIGGESTGVSITPMEGISFLPRSMN